METATPSQPKSALSLMVALGLGLALLGAAAPGHSQPPPQANKPSNDFEIAALSSRADTITGGDALIEIEVPRTVPPAQVRVSANGRDVTSSFKPAPDDGETLLGLVDGLEIGKNSIRVHARGQAPRGPKGARERPRSRRGPGATLELTNHPISGPVISGPHQQPFICQTEAFSLGSPVDEHCTAANTRILYFYMSSDDGTFKLMDPQEPKPEDLDQTTTTEGNTVDYIVRLETGTINRAVHRIAFLHDPDLPLPDPWTSTPGWNDRLVYSFGGGCQAGYRQGTGVGAVLSDELLSPGFAVASSTLNVLGNSCNDVTSAETTSLVKEHFIESFGVPSYTIGWGGSGGSIQQHLIAQNYPGLLDGIIPSASFPDITTLANSVVDCSVIFRAIDDGDHVYTQAQRSAVTGFAVSRNEDACNRWTAGGYSPGWLTPTGCPSVIPPELRYDPEANPDGARCSIHDNTVNVYGTDPATGFARRPFDNAGVQYGLQAFNDGVISFDQFAELNELVGGYDVDGNIVPQRTAADPEALRIAYESGRVNSGAGGLANVPIIDVRTYRDPLANIHDRFRSFSTRQRLIRSNGHADNHVIWIAGIDAGGTRGGPHQVEALLLMDDWLSAIASDSTGGSLGEKVIRNKPDNAVDTCWPPGGGGGVGSNWEVIPSSSIPIQEPATYSEPGICNTLYPSHADPRLIAGAPVANDILKCELKPVAQADYSPELSSDQLDRLRDIFPTGVCDYSRPGVGQQPPHDTWIRY